MQKHSISLSKFSLFIFISFFFSSITMASNANDMLLHAFIDQNESMIQATMKAQSWNDAHRIVTVSKSTSTGDILWEHHLQIAAGSQVSGMTTDLNGHVYLAGHFQGNLRLDNQLINDSPGRYFFLLSFGENGRFRFLNIWQSPAIHNLSGLQVTEFGEIWLAGQLHKASPQAQQTSLSTFWMRFDAEGQTDRAIVLSQSTANGSSSVDDHDMTFSRESQWADSILFLQGLRHMDALEGPGHIEDDPDTTIIPDDDPDMVPPPPPI